MVGQAVIPRAHHHLALEAKPYTAKNLLELQGFRDRVGWRFAFLEDSLLSSFLLTKTIRGQQQRLKMEAIQEMKDKVQEEVQEEDRTQLARQLIGPRGGLPTLKDDLVRLAHLVYVEVEPKDTVAILQAKIRPVVASLKENKPVAKPSSVTPSTAAPKSSATAAKAATPAASTSSTWSVVNPTDADDRMMQMIAMQDQKFQAMRNQVMQHVMSLQQLPSGAINLDSEDANMNENPKALTMTFALTPNRKSSVGFVR